MPTVAIIGTGLIGRAWANVFARGGWNVRLWDPDTAALAGAPKLIEEALHDVARHGLTKDPTAAAKRVSVAASLEDAVVEAGFVQENGPERVEAKLEIFARLDAAAPASAILASSSSAIVASRFTETLEGRARCLIAHPVNPPHVVPIVELCGAPWTAPETVKRARAIYEEVGQVPIEVRKEIDGFILNRMQGVLLSEAMRLVGEGFVSAEDLDKTIRDGLGLRWAFMGPFETIELNAPGGVADYCARYGAFYRRVAADAPAPEIWDDANVQRVLGDFGLSHDPAAREKRRLWRDRRLAALMAHKKGQPDGT
jgi:3-hydroxyacyl-CoA dehydrogenase